MPNLINLVVKDVITDSVPLEYEDIFSLESFGDLCAAYHSESKSFLIGRVATVDPKQPTRVYYSYYNAYQINKVIFQTQRAGDKRLLHRLLALNPLTNTDIIGDVEYFQVQGAMRSPSRPELEREIGAALTPAPASPMFVHLHQVMEQDTEMPQEAEAHKHKEKGASPSLQIRTDIEDIACINADTNKAARTPLSPGVVTQFGEPVLDAASPALPQCHSLRNAVSAGSPGVNEWLGTTAADSPVEPAQVWTAVLIATDDDYLRKSEVRKLFRENALAPEECRLYQMPDASATDQETAERRENARRIQQRLDDAASKKCLIQ